MYQLFQKAIISFAISIYLLITTGIQSAIAEHITAVVELFTSQGCSSCPPADKLMSELAKREDLVVLTYSVDYWDYLGWKDTFGSPKNTERQYAYTTVLGNEYPYTPQAVINGIYHEVGHKKQIIENLISKNKTLPVDVNLTMEGEAFKVKIEGELPSNVENSTIYVASVLRNATVFIKRGENSNRELSYTNIIQNLQPIGMWDGSSQDIMFPLREIHSHGADTFAILVQTSVNENLGQIIGAAFYR